MPWSVKKDDRCPAGEPWGVVKDTDNELEGCHPSEADAKKQQAALYASEDRSMTNIKRPPREDLFRGLFPADIELRANTDDATGPPILAGHFSVFDVPYEVNSSWEGRFIERIAKGAFRKTMAEGNRIKILFEHGQHPQLGNSVIAKPIELREDSKGAKYEATLLDGIPDLIVNGLREGLYGSSFRFNVIKDEWDDTPVKSAYNPDRLPERTIREVHVSEFGPVTFPASPEATAGVRSLTDKFHHNDAEPEKPAPPLPNPALPGDGAEAVPHSGVGSRAVPPPRPPRFKSREDYLEWLLTSST